MVIYVQELELELIALVMGDAPPVLSLGRLCMENNLRYVCDGPVPYLQNKAHRSKKVACYPHNNVPFITLVGALTSKEQSDASEGESGQPAPSPAQEAEDSTKVPEVSAE